jgi:hypothetical protein
MTSLDVLLAVAGLAATALVVAGMILLTPRGTVESSPGRDSRASRDGRARPETHCQRSVSTDRVPADR